MDKETYVMNFLDYIQQVYYDGKEFSHSISTSLITTFNKIGTENLNDAIKFFYDHNEEIEEALNTSGKKFANIGQKLGYLLGIWYYSYKNGYVYIAKKASKYEIVKEVC